MRIHVLAVGKLREPGLIDLCDEYLKRARRHVPVVVTELRTHDELARRWPGTGTVVLLDAGGRALDSVGFARYLERLLQAGRGELGFVIGGAEGVPEALRSRASERLSLGPLTLPHRIARLVLLEQIYRATTIWKGEPYHK
jgi:23S rRNA (pseudouridine1915-N3)-methyltransferase